MLMQYIGTQPAAIAALGLPVLQPGQILDLPDGYCLWEKLRNGSLREPIVQRATKELVPADPDIRANWSKLVAPAKPDFTRAQHEAAMVADGVAPAVAALKAAGQVETKGKKG